MPCAAGGAGWCWWDSNSLPVGNERSLPTITAGVSPSMTVSCTLPVRSLGPAKRQSRSIFSPMAFLRSSHETSLGSSKSAFLRDGFSSLSSNISGLPSKSRSFSTVFARAATEKTIHDFTVKDIDGNDVALSKFKGKVLLIVNVASECGLASSNYPELSNVYDKYKTQGFEILAFPCNQFGGQEPGSNAEIKEFASTKYKAEFPIFDKLDVNGTNTAPVYEFLKKNSGGLLGDSIKWNFAKFLVDKNGVVVQRYEPTTSPYQIEKDIQKALAAA